MNEFAALRARFARGGQSQVFRFWDRLDQREKELLIGQIKKIDLEKIVGLTSGLTLKEEEEKIENAEIRPAPSIAHPKNGGNPRVWTRARTVGEEALSCSKVGVLTVAGGQGTRFGYDGPKGTYPISPLTGKSFFEIFAEKIRYAQEAYRTKIPWFIMTSRENHDETARFFHDNDNFQLFPEDVFLFEQGEMPSVDFEGKILLEEAGCIATNPDGHGGSLRALVQSGAVERMRQKGVEIISYFQIDNPLVNVADPAFVGFHIEHGSEFSSKMVTKTCPAEKVGLFCLVRDRLRVIEYSDLAEEVAVKRDVEGCLIHQAGSVAIHLLSRGFVEEIGGNPGSEVCLPFHQARKKVAVIDENGEKFEPEQPNAVKFEMFIFDAILFAKNPIVVETLRCEEFSPVKNLEGLDSAEIYRAQQLRLWAQWLKKVGVDLPCDSTGLPSIRIEISPLFASTEEQFVEKWREIQTKPKVEDGAYIE